MNNVINQIPFLRTSRSFPEEIHQLALEINKTYIDIANAVNNRTISIFPTNRPVIDGESWFINNNQRQQGFRQVFNFASSGNFPHGINTTEISFFTRIYGTFTDGTNWFPLPFVDAAAANNQVELLITPTQIGIVPGGGAGQPAITNVLVILEWIVLP